MNWNLCCTLLLFFCPYLLCATDDHYSPNCSFLGTWDETVGCTCEDGWTGSDCSKLDLEPFVENSESYFQGVNDPDGPTFGGNIYKSDLSQCDGDAKYYWIGQTLGNRAGMSCWAVNSAGSIWESTSGSPLGPFQFVSWIGWGNNSEGFEPTDVPWLGNFRFTVETKLAPGATSLEGSTHAFVTYSKGQFLRRTKKFAKTSFAPPRKENCEGPLGLDKSVNGFRRDKNLQVMTIAYKELTAGTSACEREAEIRSILDSRVFVDRLNGFSRSGFVNTELTWQVLLPKIPKIPNSNNYPVNPAPLYNSPHGLIQFNGNQQWPQFTGMTKGMYYRPLFIRWNIPNVKFILSERLAVLALRADKFIWESDARYHVNPNAGPGYYEDPWFFETEHGFHVYTHDIGPSGCPFELRVSCGGSIHLSKLDVDTLMFENRWVDKPHVFNDTTLGLSAKTIVKQRPVIYFENNQPQVLLTGNIWPGEFNLAKGLWVSNQGATRSFHQRVLLKNSIPPTVAPTQFPTQAPSLPTISPTFPTRLPTDSTHPSKSPTYHLSSAPTLTFPTLLPTSQVPTVSTSSPSMDPTIAPTSSPSLAPSLLASFTPTTSPTDFYGGQCQTSPKTSKSQCEKRLKFCENEQRPMKWVVTKNNCGGGCKCLHWCKYTCKGGCQLDQNCYWKEEEGTCYEKLTQSQAGSRLDCLV